MIFVLIGFLMAAVQFNEKLREIKEAWIKDYLLTRQRYNRITVPAVRGFMPQIRTQTTFMNDLSPTVNSAGQFYSQSTALYTNGVGLSNNNPPVQW